RETAAPMAVATIATPANGATTASTPHKVTADSPWSSSQAPQPSPVTPAPTPMEATATPAAHAGTMRWSGCGTGGVDPVAGTGESSRYEVTAGTGRYASSMIRRAST